MPWVPSRGEATTHALALEARAARAGAAFACAYANSAEFDAALIAARRAAGVYGPKRRCKRMLLVAAALTMGLLAAALFVF